MTPASSAITNTIFPGKNQTQIRHRFFPLLKCRFFSSFFVSFCFRHPRPFAQWLCSQSLQVCCRNLFQLKISFQIFTLFLSFHFLALHYIQGKFKRKSLTRWINFWKTSNKGSGLFVSKLFKTVNAHLGVLAQVLFSSVFYLQEFSSTKVDLNPSVAQQDRIERKLI